MGRSRGTSTTSERRLGYDILRGQAGARRITVARSLTIFQSTMGNIFCFLSFDAIHKLILSVMSQLHSKGVKKCYLGNRLDNFFFIFDIFIQFFLLTIS